MLCDSGPQSEPGVFPDNSNDGETAEDRFFGVYEATGISSIKLSNPGGGIERDHIQFGAVGLSGATTTTTTTLPSGECADDATFTSILCRLDALIANVAGRGDLGRFKAGVQTAIQKARKQAQRASDLGTGKKARNQLKKCAKSLRSFEHKLDSNNARRINPQATRDTLRSASAAIRMDVDSLRGRI